MKKKYYLATNEKDIFHYGCLDSEQEIKTGQPVLIVVDTIEDFLEVLKNYNVEVDINEYFKQEQNEKTN
jgi:hypothetical protein